MRILAVLGFGAMCLTCSAVENLGPLLESTRQQYGLPAVAAVLMKDGRIVDEGIAGTRILGRDLPATLDLALVLLTNIGGKKADLAFRELAARIMGKAVAE
jgi:hypothetical protein